MLARRRNAVQRRGPTAATSATTAAGAGGGASATTGATSGVAAATASSGSAGADLDSQHGGGNHSSNRSETMAIIEERLAAFAPFVLPSLINGDRLDDAVGDSSVAEDLNGASVTAAAAMAGGLNSSSSAGVASSSVGSGGGRAGLRVTQAVLLMYLHIGSSPPDFPRVEPCAKLECWTDPLVAHVAQHTTGGGGGSNKSGSSGSDSITEALEQQYRTVLSKTATVLRVAEADVDVARAALSKAKGPPPREGRVLVHYNGHGMPSATLYGEVWMFDKAKTHYVPLNVLEMTELVGSPALYVFDCNAAGAILARWQQERLQERRPHDLFICACGPDRTLPLNPKLPADMLTSCLTTPLKMALEWYIHLSHFQTLLPDVTEDMIRGMPGTLQDHSSPRGELNWVLGAILTSIAWCTMPAQQFHLLFRHDSTTKALFRNAILADRLMREAGCTPVTHPRLSEAAHLHPMWELWEFTLERTISQLPRLLSHNYNYSNSAHQRSTVTNESSQAGTTTVSSSGLIGRAPGAGASNDSLATASHSVDSVPELVNRRGTASTTTMLNTSAAAVQTYVSPLTSAATTSGRVGKAPVAVYEPSTFLDDQLTAFAVWVHCGDMSQLPEQLPCVLLALSHKSYQVRAFTLLAKYLDAGRAAGKRAILCGLLPVLSKLLGQDSEIFLIVTVLWMQVVRADPVEGCLEAQQYKCERRLTKLLVLDDKLTRIAPVEYGQSVHTDVDGAEAAPAAASPHAKDSANPPRAQHQLPQQQEPPLVVPLRGLTRQNSLPASRSFLSLDTTDTGADFGSGAEPLQPVSGIASAHNYGNSSNSTQQQQQQQQQDTPLSGERTYYLMKDVDLTRCKSMACYVLCQYQLRGEVQCMNCWNTQLLNAAFPNLSSPSAELRSWSCLVLSKLFAGLRHAKNFASRECASRLDLFTRLLQDHSPLVRSSCVTLLASVVGVRMDLLPACQQVRRLQMEKSLMIKLRGYAFDASMSVREELIFFASQVLYTYCNALPAQYTRCIHKYVEEVERQPSAWQLTEADVAVKSLLNAARPTVNLLFDDAIVFETALCLEDDPLPMPPEMDPELLCSAARDITQGLLHDAALLLCTLYRNCDNYNVKMALRMLSRGEPPRSQRFASEALRTMSHVASLDSSYYLSEADRTRMTWNADMMKQLVLDLRGRKLEHRHPRRPLTLELSASSPTAAVTAVDSSNTVIPGSGNSPTHSTSAPTAVPHLRRSSSSSAALATVSPSLSHPHGASVSAEVLLIAELAGGSTAPLDLTTAHSSNNHSNSNNTSAATTAVARHQVLASAVRSDTVICTAFRALEASLVTVTKNQKIHYVSYDSYTTQSVLNSFSLPLSGPIHDVLVINDLSEQSGLLITTKRGSFSLVKGCWERESIPTAAAVFSACPPPPPNTWLDIKSAYRTNTATLFYGGAIGTGDNAGGTEIHLLSLAEEQVTQRLQVSGNPALTGLVTHTTQRALFGSFADGVVRYYDDRQRQGQVGTVGMMLCRPLANRGSITSAMAEPVVGLGLVMPDFSGSSGGAAADGAASAAGGGGNCASSAPFTLAAATRNALYVFDARKLSEPVLAVSHADLYSGIGRQHYKDSVVPALAAGASNANGSNSNTAPFLTACSVGAHTGLVALAFSDGTYGAYNAKGLLLSDTPLCVASSKQQPATTATATAAPSPLPLPLPTSCVAHPLRPLMSYGGDLLFLQL